MAHVSTPIVGASFTVSNGPLNAASDAGASISGAEGDTFLPGTIVEGTDNIKAIYAVASAAITSGATDVTVTRVADGDYTAASGAGSLTYSGPDLAIGEAGWFWEQGVVTAS